MGRAAPESYVGLVPHLKVPLPHFLGALLLLGVGWNFLYIGGTTLFTQAYRPEEKDKAQGAINFCVFAVMAVSSFSSGALVTTQGWQLLNIISIVPITLAGVALAWYVAGEARSRPKG